jgi:hypothetical protein
VFAYTYETSASVTAGNMEQHNILAEEQRITWKITQERKLQIIDNTILNHARGEEHDLVSLH